MTIKVSIDASGGDFGFPVTVKAGINALSVYEDLQLNFVGNEIGIQAELNKNSANKAFIDRIAITHANDVINMGDSPSTALRHKKDSSMRVAIDLIENGTVDACVIEIRSKKVL